MLPLCFQESVPSKEKKLDDDEDRRNPQYIPKRGTFYEHDDRTAEVDESQTRCLIKIVSVNLYQPCLVWLTGLHTISVLLPLLSHVLQHPHYMSIPSQPCFLYSLMYSNILHYMSIPSQPCFLYYLMYSNILITCPYHLNLLPLLTHSRP
uniref:Protein CASC3 n=1 Tax=Timema monikensis TaxID=170555 RepID=A0A7R9EJP9_9NEOP|nr:unnamed protein product [Timema monikensis]